MKYRAEIDGLRAVAVVPVILFHAGFNAFSGGYVGVDVFFVISGYLITQILLHEIQNNTLSIGGFYERRARRILPALFLVMAACIPFAYLWMLPSQFKDFGQSLIAVVFFSSNILFWREDGYFAAAAELKPLLHTWSLSVEEQFYLIFPIFFMLIWRLGKKGVAIAIIIMAICSFALAEWGSHHKPSATFYLAPTRAWELLAGSMCALIGTRSANKFSNMIGIIGLIMIISGIIYYDKNTPFPSSYTMLPVVGASLVIIYGTTGTYVARLLSVRLFVGFGLVSYSTYLWHQPLFSFARLRILPEPSQNVMMMLAVASLFLGWATWRWVEQPFRSRDRSIIKTRSQVYFTGGSIGAALSGVGLLVSSHIWLSYGDNLRNSADLSENRLDVNYGLSADCEGSFNLSSNCRTSHLPNVLLWGDSYAMHLVQGILASSSNIDLQQHTIASCSPIVGIARIGGMRRTQALALDCIEFNARVLEWLRANSQVNLVILSSPFGILVDRLILNENGETITSNKSEVVLNRFIETINDIRSVGARVIIVSPTPSPTDGWDIGQCAMRSVLLRLSSDVCNFELNIHGRLLSALRQVENHAPIYWLHEDVCRSGRCLSIVDGYIIFRDEGHLSKEGSHYLGRTNKWMLRFNDMAR